MDEALLIQAYRQPDPLWAERSSYYKQWRLVQGESLDPEKERFQVPRQLTTSSFKVTDPLGEGNYSQVLFAKLRSTQVRVCWRKRSQLSGRSCRRDHNCASAALGIGHGMVAVRVIITSRFSRAYSSRAPFLRVGAVYVSTRVHQSVGLHAVAST